MRKAAIAAAVAAALGMAGCSDGPGGPGPKKIADTWCQTHWAKAQSFARNETEGPDYAGKSNDVYQLAKSAFELDQIKTGNSCKFS